MQKDGEKVVGRDRKAAVMRTGDGENTGKRRDGRRCKRAGKSGGKKGGARWEERCGDETRGERGTAKEVQKALSAIELNLQSSHFGTSYSVTLLFRIFTSISSHSICKLLLRIIRPLSL